MRDQKEEAREKNKISCRECGKTNPNVAIFCMYCGCKLRLLQILQVSREADLNRLMEAILFQYHPLDEVPSTTYEAVVWALNTMKLARRRQIFIRVFGLDGKGFRTQAETARELGISSQVVRTNLNRGLQYLAHPLRFKVLKGQLPVPEN